MKANTSMNKESKKAAKTAKARRLRKDFEKRKHILRNNTERSDRRFERIKEGESAPASRKFTPKKK